MNPDTSRNYNVFINKSLNHAAITPKNQTGCVTSSSVLASNLTAAPGFDDAYNQTLKPFSSFSDAKNACKLWAADIGQMVFAINKDSNNKYGCYTGGSLPDLASYVKPKSLYTVLAGVLGSSIKGGLFANGQIGVWAGQADPRWNIINMKPATLIKKFNSNNYSGGPAGHGAAINGDWWGAPRAVGSNGWTWGVNKFPNKIAWWISIDDFWKVGSMGYFYYVYNSPVAKTNIKIYMVIDDAGELNINGVNSTIAQPDGAGYGGWTHTVNLLAGKNVIRFKLVNTGGPGAFVLYGYDESASADNKVLFMSGPGWGTSDLTPPGDYNLITNTPIDSANPTGIKTLNAVPAGYSKCDPVFGGKINKSSVSATYGLNCSNVTNPPLNIRYIRVTPNDKGDYIQIISLKVNAFVNGVLTNVSTRGTATAANVWPGHNASDAITEGGFYHSATAVPGNWWQLDLGQDYPVTDIEYKNRTDCCQDRQLGMKMSFIANNGTSYGPLSLTAALKQNFNISSNGLTAESPVNIGGNDGAWNGYSYDKAQATAVCAARGARLCTIAELNNSDFCSCGWAQDSEGTGYPMAHGDPTPQGWCGGSNGGKVWRTCGWFANGSKGSAHCCK
jgi:hypothetical protein